MISTDLDNRGVHGTGNIGTDYVSNHGSSTGTTGALHGTHRDHATSGATGPTLPGAGIHTTPGSGNAPNTAGPHNSDMMNKLDPRYVFVLFLFA